MEDEEEGEVMETQPLCALQPNTHPGSSHLSAAQIFSPSEVGLYATDIIVILSLTTALSLSELQGGVSPTSATGQTAPPTSSHTHGGGQQCCQTGHSEWKTRTNPYPSLPSSFLLLLLPPSLFSTSLL